MAQHNAQGYCNKHLQVKAFKKFWHVDELLIQDKKWLINANILIAEYGIIGLCRLVYAKPEKYFTTTSLMFMPALDDAARCLFNGTGKYKGPWV